MTSEGQPALVPRPVDAAIAAEWRAFFAGGGVFSLPAAVEANGRKRRNNAVFLTVLAVLAAATAIVGITLLVTSSGRGLTYVLLVIVLIGTVAAGARILTIRRALNAVRDSPEEYVAVFRDGMRFAGVEFPWTAVVGGLVIDERSVTHSGLKRLTAKIMLAAGHARMEMLIGVQPNTVREYRAQAPGAVRRVFFVSMGSGGPRIPLEYALEDDSVNAFATAVRVSAADADVPIIVSTDPPIMHATIMAIWRGTRPATGKGTE
ncbi:MAG: hypothetical protein ACTH8F_00205 [Microbacterium sp.]|uniref:hypothetical protein n=1 Tax=Microbacterium sp. TaxID=51671 RepID=UPI003F9E32EE